MISISLGERRGVSPTCLSTVIVIALLFAPASVWSQDKAAEPTEREPNEARLSVGRNHGHAGGSLVSERVRDDGTRVLHGLQVKYGPGMAIREYSVVNDGRVEQLVQLYPNGDTFRSQHRHHNGDGDEVIYAAGRTKVIADQVIVASGENIGPIKTQETLAQGTVKAGRRHAGTFLVRELEGYQFRWRKQEYKDGKPLKSEPFPLDRLELKAIPGADDGERWPWSMPDWPGS